MKNISSFIRNIIQDLTYVKVMLDEHNITKTITIFGSARITPENKYYKDAVVLTQAITQWAPDIAITTGGGPGIMEAAAVGSSNTSIGYCITLPKENCNLINKLRYSFKYFFTRKLMLLYHAKAIIVFPGGFGTLDELFEVLTLIQCKKIEPSIPVILYGSQFWCSLIPMISTMLDHKTISFDDTKLYTIVDTVEDTMNILKEKLSAS